MKTLKEYMALNYPMEIIRDEDEGGYAVRFPDLPGCLSCGQTIEDAIVNAEDAKRIWLCSMIEDGKKINEPSEIAESDIIIRLSHNIKSPKFRNKNNPSLVF